MTPALARLAASGGDDVVDVIIRRDTMPDTDELQCLTDLGVSVTRTFPMVGMLALSAPGSLLGEVGGVVLPELMAIDEPPGKDHRRGLTRVVRQQHGCGHGFRRGSINAVR